MKHARLYPFRGRMLPASTISRMTGIPTSTIRQRALAGHAVDAPMPRAVKQYEFRGECLPIKSIAAKLGIARQNVYRRISGDRVLEADELKRPDFEPHPIAVPVFFAGESLSLTAWAQRTGIPYGTLHHRLAHGWAVERALTTPSAPRLPMRAVRVHNHRIILRIAKTFRTTKTGGQSSTFGLTLGTGVGRRVTDLQPGKACDDHIS